MITFTRSIVFLSLIFITNLSGASEASKTLLGPDLDKNHVRDDVDEYIKKEFKDPAIRKAMTRFAKSKSELLKDHSQETHKKFIMQNYKDEACVFTLLPFTNKTVAVTRLIMNTSEREKKSSEVITSFVELNFKSSDNPCKP